MNLKSFYDIIFSYDDDPFFIRLVSDTEVALHPKQTVIFSQKLTIKPFLSLKNKAPFYLLVSVSHLVRLVYLRHELFSSFEQLAKKDVAQIS